MKNFQELKEKRPELAEMLESMSKEELLNYYAIELEEKDELEDDLETLKHAETELDYIINLGIKWLRNNKKNKHHIFIDQKVARLIYTNEEKVFV